MKLILLGDAVQMLTGNTNVALMSFWEPAARASLSGLPSLCRRKKWKMREREVSESRQRKKSTVCVGNLSANFITGSLKGLPSWREERKFHNRNIACNHRYKSCECFTWVQILH